MIEQPPTRVKTCCTSCGNGIGDKFCLDTNNNIKLNKTPTFCDDCTKLYYNDCSYISRNKQLSGKPNPKTLIPPVIAPRISELSYWKNNNLVTHSHINTQKTEPLFESGFFETTCCEKNKCLVKDNCCDNLCYKPQLKNQEVVKENYEFRHEDIIESEIHNSPDVKEGLTAYQRLYQNQLLYRPEPPKESKIQLDIQKDIDISRNNGELKLTTQQSIKPGGSGKYINEVRKCCIPQDINITCGYDKNNPFKSGLPTNFAAPNCIKDERMKTYNENLFTQIIEPGVYTRSEVLETPNANIGISLAQPFEPVTYRKDKSGVLYTQHDPNLITEVIEPNVDFCDDEPTIYDVYDPRCVGYGTSYRAYNNEFIGQPRFMYDDIDAVRMPNYLSRNNIDHLSYADTYGPMKPCESEGNINTPDIRNMANQSFMNSTIQFRTELQERLMRKANNIAWQQRLAPISRSGFCAK